jgi:arylformamidase
VVDFKRSEAAWIDISVPLRNGMVRWPGDTGFQAERVQQMAQGDTCNLSRVSMGMHTGTHIDAPLHFVRDGVGIDRMPIEAMIGPARVLQIDDDESIKSSALTQHAIRSGERLLFKTRNSTRAWQTDEFVTDYVHVSLDAARFLVERKVRTVGIDYLSVGGYERDGDEVHRTLLGAGIWLIEGLNLAAVAPGRYELVCLPLNYENGDGAPARAVLRPLR